MRLEIDMRGLSTVIRKFDREVRGIKQRTKRGLQKAGFLILNRSVILTPIEWGYLRKAARAKALQEQGERPYLEIGYYGNDYAIYVHEINKRYRAPGTQWKFLETAVSEKGGDALKIIRDEAKV